MSGSCPVFYDDEDFEQEYGWPPRREETQGAPSVHPDDMPTATGPDRVAQAIARDRDGARHRRPDPSHQPTDRQGSRPPRKEEPMSLTPDEQAALDALTDPRPVLTLRSAGRYAITLTIEDPTTPIPPLDEHALAQQLRELADALDPDGPEPCDGEIRYVKGTDQLDEIVLDNVDVHIEQMSESCYWMSFSGRGDQCHKRLTVNFAPAAHVKRSVPLNGYVDENDLGVKETR